MANKQSNSRVLGSGKVIFEARGGSMGKLVLDNNVSEKVAGTFEFDDQRVGDIMASFKKSLEDQASEIFDSDGRLHSHLAIFLDGRLISERETSNRHANADSVLTIIKALSGG